MAGRTRTVADLEVMLRANTVQLQKGLDDVKRKIQDTGKQVQQSSREMRGGLEETREGLMLVGDQIGVHLNREVSRFLAEIPAVSKAVSLAFSSVAIFALIQMVVEAGEKVEAFVKTNSQAAEKNKEAFDSLQRSQEATNKQLDLSGIKLDNELAKLEHKPENKLAESLAEAAVQAQELSDKLQGSIEKYQKLLQQEAPTWMDEVLKGQAGTGYEQTMLHQHQIHLAQASTMPEIQGEETSYQASLQTRLAQLQAWQRGKADASGILQVGNFKQEIAAVQQMMKFALPESYAVSDTIHNNATQGRIDSIQGENEADQDRLKVLQANLEKKEEILGKDNAFELAYWNSVIGQLHKGTSAYQEAQQKQHTAFMGMEADFRKMWESAKKSAPGDGEFMGAAVRPTRATPGADQLSAAQARAAEIVAQNQAGMQAVRVRIGLATGAITPHQAAQSEAESHTQEYMAAVLALDTELARIEHMDLTGDPQMQAKEQELRNQISQLTGKYNAQSAEDSYSVRISTASGQVIDSLDQLTKAFTDTGKQISELFTKSLGTVNDTIMQVLTTPGSMRIGKHLWGHAGSAIATDVGRTSLEHAEGSLLKGLGLGKKVQEVKVTNWPSGSGTSGTSGTTSSILGWLNNSNWAGNLFGGRLFGSGGFFGGGHALGGDVVGGMSYTVGELGPEELRLPAGMSGSVIPHSQSFRPTNQISIDARGASDPAAVNAAVHNAMAAYLPHIGPASVAAQRDSRRRSAAGRG
jgi:hypothetical protein